MTRGRVVGVLPLVALLAVASGVGVGCAERQSEGQYEDTIKTMHTERTMILRQLTPERSRDLTWLSTSQGKVEGMGRDLEAIQPPAVIESAHDRHVEGLDGLARILSRLADCARLEKRERARGEECRGKINQLELDEVRNDLDEADTIYREHGLKLDQPGA